MAVAVTAAALLIGPTIPRALAQARAPLQAPTVTLEVIPDRDAIERGEELAVVVVVTNKSEVTLTEVAVSVPSAMFGIAPASSGPAQPLPAGASPPRTSVLPTVPGFGSVNATVALKPIGNVSFGPHKVPVIVRYSWSPPSGPSRMSAQTATITLQIRRRFEEEGRSLPGGTAVFLYLLLPVVPAFLAYDVVERLRRGEGLGMPKFGPEHIMPALLISLLLSVGFAAAINWNIELAYTDPRLFIGVLALSAALGVVIPAARWARSAYHRRRWAFKDTDSGEEYLRKALLGPRTPAEFVWVTATAGGETWKGVQLYQPDGSVVLGARVQVTSADSKEAGPYWKALVTDVFDGEAPEAVLRDRQRLVTMAQAKTAKVKYAEHITRGGTAVEAFVRVNGLRSLTPSATEAKPLVQLVR